MVEKSSTTKKGKQISLAEYAKIKEKTAKSKLNLTFPWMVKACFFIPLVYCLFLVLFYIFKIRFTAEH